MTGSIGIGDIVSVCALGVSIYSLIKTSRQEKIVAELNEIQLEKEKQASIDAKKAVLGASFVRSGTKGGLRLRVFNKSKAVARNISLSFPNGNEVVVEHDIKRKLPFTALEPQGYIELLALTHLGTDPNFVVSLKWDDDFCSENEKKVYLTIH